MSRVRYGLVKVVVINNREFITEQIMSGYSLAIICQTLSEKTNFEIKYESFRSAVNRIILNNKTTDGYIKDIRKKEKYQQLIKSPEVYKTSTTDIDSTDIKQNKGEKRSTKIFKPQQTNSFDYNDSSDASDFI